MRINQLEIKYFGITLREFKANGYKINKGITSKTGNGISNK